MKKVKQLYYFYYRFCYLLLFPFLLGYKKLTKSKIKVRSKKSLTIALSCLLILFSSGIFYLFSPFINKAEAAWFNDDFAYRKAVPLNKTVSQETNTYVNFTGVNAIDTSNTTRFQSNCGDLRFTDANGKLLKYYIVSGCGTATTVVHVLMPTFPLGDQVIYYYYGNPSAFNAAQSTDFSTAATNYTFGSLGSEENAPSPVVWWKLDDGQGTSTVDSSSNKNNGTITSSSWQTEDQCISGKCLRFDGSTSTLQSASNINITGNPTVSISVWVNFSSVASGAHSIVSFGATGAGSGFAILQGINGVGSLSVEIYGNNGCRSAAGVITTNQWYHIEATKAVGGISTSNTKLYLNGVPISLTCNGSTVPNITNGKLYVGTDAANEFSNAMTVDDVKVYNFTRTASQVTADYNAKLNNDGASGVLGANTLNQPSSLSNGLVGYWKMDEASWNGTAGEVKDASGTGNNGTAACTGTGCSKASTAAGKFGNGGSFDGSTQYVTVSQNSSINIAGSLTISTWVNPTASPTAPQIISKSTTGSGYDLWLTNFGANRVNFAINRGAYSIVSNGVVPQNQWSLITVVYDGTKAFIYINGVLDNTSAFGTLVSNTVPLSIAQDGANNSWFPGYIDELRIYNRALSSTDVQFLYNWAPGPTAYYSFDEGTGVPNDHSGYGTNATSFSGSGTPHYSNGAYGKAGNFDGSSDYVFITGNNYTRPTKGLSYSVWFNAGTSQPSNGRILSTNSTQNSGYDMDIIAGTGILQVDVSNSVQTGTQSNASVLDNKWHHAEVTYDGSNIRLYLDGILQNTAAGPSSVAYVNDLLIGANNSVTPASFFRGKIDEVKIYNYARSANQVIEDMNAQHPTGGQLSPIGNWKFDEGFSTTAHNSASQGATLDGTLTNSPSWTNSGKYGKALTFNGSNSYVDLTNNTSTKLSSGTISAWIKTSNAGSSFRSIVVKQLAYSMFLGGTGCSDNNLTLYDWSTSSAKCSSSGNIADNKWHHVAVVFQSGVTNGTTFYIDGKAVGTTTMTVTGQTVSLQVGADGGVQIFTGSIDNVKLYNFTLTQSQILMDMQDGSFTQLGSLSSNNANTDASTAASQAYCIPGDSTSCAPPVGEWNFEQKTGSTVYDTSGNGLNGTWQGTLGNQWTRGQIGTAGKFNSSDNYVNVPYNSALAINALTVEAWIKSTNTSKIMHVATRDGVDRIWQFRVEPGSPTGIRLIVFDNSTNYQCVSSSQAVDGTWHFIAGSWDGSTMNIYVDGRIDKSCSTTASSLKTGTTGPLTIGYGEVDGFANIFDGLIDQVKVFGYARSPAQVAWDYNRGGPIAWYKFDECQGNTFYDSSGNSLNGTWNGSGSGTQTSTGNCNTNASTAWYNGKNGKFNSSLNFDGTDDYVTVPYDAKLDLTTYTVCTWVNLNNAALTNRYPAILSYGTNNGLFYEFLVNSGTTTVSWNYAGASLTTGSLGTGSWNQICAVKNGSSKTLYVNGLPIASGSDATGVVHGTSQQLYIGTSLAGSSSNWFLDGKVDDARIYNYPLTSTQIKLLYNGGAIRFGPVTGLP